ncbi:MAG: HEPN domain-containing protein [Candidatus Hydrogenedentota bacterium]
MNIDIEKLIEYWVNGACYDLDVADSLYNVGKYPYALFFGHLAIEKLLKAHVVKASNDHAPYTHSLPLLASKLTLEIPDEIRKKFAKFMEFYFEARYPDQQKIYFEKCTKEFSLENLSEIREVFQWLLLRLGK